MSHMNMFRLRMYMYLASSDLCLKVWICRHHLHTGIQTLVKAKVKVKAKTVPEY